LPFLFEQETNQRVREINVFFLFQFATNEELCFYFCLFAPRCNHEIPKEAYQTKHEERRSWLKMKKTFLEYATNKTASNLELTYIQQLIKKNTHASR
jgi:hypothetical protein